MNSTHHISISDLQCMSSSLAGSQLLRRLKPTTGTYGIKLALISSWQSDMLANFISCIILIILQSITRKILILHPGYAVLNARETGRDPWPWLHLIWLSFNSSTAPRLCTAHLRAPLQVLKVMDQTLIAGTAKRSDLWEEPTSLCGVKGSLPQSSQPRHGGNGGQLCIHDTQQMRHEWQQIAHVEEKPKESNS